MCILDTLKYPQLGQTPFVSHLPTHDIPQTSRALRWPGISCILGHLNSSSQRRKWTQSVSKSRASWKGRPEDVLWLLEGLWLGWLPPPSGTPSRGAFPLEMLQEWPAMWVNVITQETAGKRDTGFNSK